MAAPAVAAPSPPGRLFWAGLRTILGALGGETLRLRAMALTYISLFAVVPALVLAFSAVQAFAGTTALSNAIHEYVLANLAVGARRTIEPYLDEFVKNAHTTSAGLVGGAILVISAVGLFRSFEAAINEIWAVRRARALSQRVLVYWAGLTLGPVLLAASVALGGAVGAFLSRSALGLVLARLAGVLITCTLFSALYLFVPATRVRWRAAVVGGVVAGATWELAKTLYAVVVWRFFHFHAVYGSVAAIAVFLLWLEVSWTLVLFGARVSFVVQHAQVLLRGHAEQGGTTPLGRELLAGRIMLEIAVAYVAGRPPVDPARIAVSLETFAEPVRLVLGTLRQAGLVLELPGGGFVPARPLANITLADVRRAMSGEAPRHEGAAEAGIVASLLSEAEGTAASTLARTAYDALCAASVSPPALPVGARRPRASSELS